MSMLKLPSKLTTPIEIQNQWLAILKQAETTVKEDSDIQNAAAKGMRIKGRAVPPEILGRSYAKYCALINKMYDAYLNNIHLQRAPYIQEIINVLIKRVYELRHEITRLIVNDYIYVDSALASLQMTPLDIQIVVPYHFPVESRSEDLEQILQKLWEEAVKRKKRKEIPKKPKPPPPIHRESRVLQPTIEEREEEVSEEESESPPPSEHTLIPEEFIQAVIIQRHERFRQWRMRDLRSQAAKRKLYFLDTGGKPEAPEEFKHKASNIIQLVYREYMKIKRERVKNVQRDIILGLIPDPFRSGPSFVEENNKLYERRRKTRLKIKETYLKELEKENTRLLLFKKGDQIDDITDEIRCWFKEWFYGYNFFPEFPYELEGGTLLVVRGEYPTIDEKKEQDEKLLALTKGKTKEQIKDEKERAKADAALKAQIEKEKKKKEEILLMKSKCNPFTDPGYKLEQSEVIPKVVEALRDYRMTWSLYDDLPTTEKYGLAIYGYLKPLLIEDLMKDMHLECRKFIDEMMRLDLKLLIKKHQQDFKSVGWKYPKIKPRKKPRPPKLPKTLEIDEHLFKRFERIFDFGLITKPTTKLKDIFGESNYAAYDYNIKDPDASFPLPGYGDIRERLMMSCILGCGIQPGATRRKAVMLLGPDRNGKAFLADAVAGELNAVKIDITPEVFSAVVPRAVRLLTQVFLVARAFQPSVVFLKNIERVFSSKVPPEEIHLQATSMKTALVKLVRQIQTNDKVIFIATCTNPWVAKIKPMLNMFDEILLVPRTDYATLQQFFYNKLLSIRSIPRDYPVQPIAQMLQGYGFGEIIDLYNDVMTPERIVRLNIHPLSPGEFLEPLLAKNLEPTTSEDYQQYVDFFIKNTWLKKEREEYTKINFFREDMYKKQAKKLKTVD